jgi:uncharacterized membrane protein YagU involved in acid resistance
MTNLLTGAAAGLLATIPMTMVMEALHQRLPGEPPRPLPPREITEAAVVKAGVGREVSERDKEDVTLAAHFGYGALCGAVFGLIAPRNRAAAVGSGMLFGLGVWAGSYAGWLPATGMRHSPRYDPAARSGLMIGAHVVWGGVVGLIVGQRSAVERQT